MTDKQRNKASQQAGGTRAVPLGLRKYPARGQESTEPAELLLSQEAAEHKVHGTACPRGACSLTRGHPSATHLWGLLLSPLPGPGLALLLRLPSTPPRPLAAPSKWPFLSNFLLVSGIASLLEMPRPQAQKAWHAPCSAP